MSYHTLSAYEVVSEKIASSHYLVLRDISE